MTNLQKEINSLRRIASYDAVDVPTPQESDRVFTWGPTTRYNMFKVDGLMSFTTSYKTAKQLQGHAYLWEVVHPENYLRREYGDFFRLHVPGRSARETEIVLQKVYCDEEERGQEAF